MYKFFVFVGVVLLAGIVLIAWLPGNDLTTARAKQKTTRTAPPVLQVEAREIDEPLATPKEPAPQAPRTPEPEAELDEAFANLEDLLTPKQAKPTILADWDDNATGEVKVHVLLDALLEFKSNEQFHRYKWAIGGPFSRWDVLLTAERRIKRRHVSISIAFADIYSLGEEYFDTKGSESPRTKMLKESILSQVPRKALEAAAKVEEDEKVREPWELKYQIFSKDHLPGIKSIYEVRLNRNAEPEELEAISKKIKKGAPRGNKSVYITFHLPTVPGVKHGSGAYATGHYTPKLDVQFAGLTFRQESQLLKLPVDPERALVGEWMDQSPYVGGKITIYEQGKKYWHEWRLPDDDEPVLIQLQKHPTRGGRYDRIPLRSDGEHYVIRFDGILESRDNQGLIQSAAPITRN